MAHKYYCTHCARELDQDRVLMDMEYALTVNSEEGEEGEKFRLLKFLVTIQEFQDLLAKGTPGDLGYLHFDLSVEDLAAYMANAHNLNDPDIAGLTLEDIDGYLADRRGQEFGASGDDSSDAMDFLGGGGLDDLFGGPAQTEEKTVEKYEPSDAIKALKGKIATAKGDNLTERLLEEDLDLLRKLVGENGCISIDIKATDENSDKGDKILTGYYARRGAKQIVKEARRCCHCGTLVFKHAGAAVHRAVAFIGEQKSGKTSTILALSHYAERAARTVQPGDTIWGSSTSIPGIQYIELVGKDEELEGDLGLYDIGVAPKKTQAQQREDAYSSTLWITNTRGEKFILTLTDLPGELCNLDGTIQRDKILNEFPVAMSSDVFIMCFDTMRAKGSAASGIISRTCKWASEFQSLRQEYKKHTVIREPGDTSPELTEKCVAPMMVVFTKCEDLENGVAENLEIRNHHNPKRAAEVYSLKVEREFIDRNPVYREVGEMVQEYENLKKAYVARLRTSPYGFEAPTKPVYLENKSVNKNPDGTIRYPSPKHVAELMNWLMIITGCVPVPAEFVPNPVEPHIVRRLDDTVYVRRPQYRCWEPQGETYKDKVDEAQYRAYLFENYSAADEGYLTNYNDKSWKPVGSVSNKDGGNQEKGIFGKIRELFGM